MYEVVFRLVQLVAIGWCFYGLSRGMGNRVPELSVDGFPQYMYFYGMVALAAATTLWRLGTSFDLDFWNHVFLGYWIVGVPIANRWPWAMRLVTRIFQGPQNRRGPGVA